MNKDSYEDNNKFFTDVQFSNLREKATKLENPIFRAMHEIVKNENYIIDNSSNNFNIGPTMNINNELVSLEICHNDISNSVNGQIEIERKNTPINSLYNALQHSERHLRSTTEGTKLGTYQYDFLSRTLDLSPELRKILGNLDRYDIENTIMYIMQYDEKNNFLDALNDAKNPAGDGILNYNYKKRHADGSVCWYLIQGQTYFEGEGDNGRPIFSVGVIIDITKTMAAENHIRELSHKLHNILDNLDGFIWSVDNDLNITYSNSKIKKHIETDFKSVFETGMNIKDVLPADVANLWIELINRATREGKFTIDIKAARSDHFFSVTIIPIYNLDSEIIEITVYGKDMTDRIMYEKEVVMMNDVLEKKVIERTLQLKETTDDLKTFSLTIAHDLKAHFRRIEHCAVEIFSNKDEEKNTAEIISACNNGIKMIERLFDYECCSNHDIKKENVNIKNMISSVYQDIKQNYKTQHSIICFETGFPLVYADMQLLQLVINNIITNAFKFAANRDKIKIIAGCRSQNEEYIFYFKDNGIGFDMKYSGKLFRIFERLHSEEFEGNGIGLAIVKNIVEKHGGRTWIIGEPDAGCTLFFTLPKKEEV